MPREPRRPVGEQARRASAHIAALDRPGVARRLHPSERWPMDLEVPLTCMASTGPGGALCWYSAFWLEPAGDVLCSAHHDQAAEG